jgi:hypothetical protein
MNVPASNCSLSVLFISSHVKRGAFPESHRAIDLFTQHLSNTGREDQELVLSLVWAGDLYDGSVSRCKSSRIRNGIMIDV